MSSTHMVPSWKPAHYARAVLATLLLAVCAAPIFDGRTLEGFEIIGPDAWRVEDGVIIGSAQELEEQSWLYWPGTVSDFTLTLDFRIDAGNSRAVPLPKSIDCNRIKSRIGSGGMGTVV
jgi:hypothetical protein